VVLSVSIQNKYKELLYHLKDLSKARCLHVPFLLWKFVKIIWSRFLAFAEMGGFRNEQWGV
jgi:hypothetical protein